MKRFLVLLSLIGAVFVASAAGVAATHGPIVILGNTDFTAENGVVGGTGTVSDPYVISGWEISAGGAVYAVKIENVTAPFVLRGLIIQGAFDSGGAAVRIAFSSGGRIEGCSISNSLHGIEILSSERIAMTDCVLYVSGVGLRVAGETPEEYHHDIADSNTLNGRPILYYYGLDGETIEGHTPGHLTVADSRNVTISENEVKSGDGIQLAFVSDSTVSGNSVYRASPLVTEHGILLYRSERNEILRNSLRNNRLAGIQLALSSDNELRDNQILANEMGIRLVASDRNTIADNVVFANPTGIYLSGGSAENELIGNVVYHKNTKLGVSLELATGNRIERNGLSDCEIGISLSAQATDNRVIGNTIVSGGYGISLYGSSNLLEGNLIAQQSRGLLFPESFGKSTAAANEVRNNVFTDNANHVYVNLDSARNRFSLNAFFGQGNILDYGVSNLWADDGAGNFWEGTPVIDNDGNGIGESSVTVYPSTAQDTAPLVSVNLDSVGVGIIGTLATTAVEIVRSDGTTLNVPVRAAVAPCERWAGFRGFPAQLIGDFPGILFRFDEEAERRFTMVTVLFDLDIAFFAAGGTFVGGTQMTANAADLYTAGKAFQYALELPAGSLESLQIGVGSRLLVP